MGDKHIPCIIIPGVGQSKLILTDEKGNGIKTVWPLNTDKNAILEKIKKPYLRSVATRKDKGFSDAIHDFFYESLEPMTALPDGSMKHRIECVLREYPASHFSEGEKRFLYRLAPVKELAREIGEENIYLFSFNFFADLYESAERLDSFIEKVKKQSLSEKVCLIPISMGGALSTAYFDIYGEKNDIAKVIFIEAALDGSVLMTDIFSKNIDKNNGYSALEFATSKKASDGMRALLSLIPWDVRYSVLYKSLEAAFVTAVGNSPSMWSTVPKEDTDRLRGELLHAEKYMELNKRVDRFMRAQRDIRNILAKRQSTGTEIYICAGYGRRLMALSANGETSSDTVLSVGSMSLGATSAPLGKKLPTECISKSSRLSPDGSVDVSTAFFRDTTWFLKGQVHNDTCFNPNVQRLVRRAVADRDFSDVFSDPELPQFTEAIDIRR